MKTNLTFILLPLFLLAKSPLNSQPGQFGLTGNLGVSQISHSFPQVLKHAENSNNTPFLAGNAGMFFYKPFSKRWSVGAELIFTSIKGKGRLTNDQPSVGPFFMSTTYTSKIVNKLNYIGLPVFFRLQADRMAFKIGFQYLHLSYAGYDEWRVDLSNDSTEKYGWSLANGLYNNDFGPKLGYEYRISPSSWLRADMYIRLSDISETYRRNRQYTLGLNYHLTQQ